MSTRAFRTVSRHRCTGAVRAGIDRDSAFGAVTPPIVLSSNFSFAGFEQKRQYDYTRSGNPTRDLLAEALSELEGGAGAVVTATGMAAITLVLALIQPGERLLVRDGNAEWRRVLLDGLRHASADAQGTHVLFDTPAEAEGLRSDGFFPRLQYQYWWLNDGYRSWDEFLQRFPSKDRNKLRRERKEVAHLRIDTIVNPDREVLDALYGFYADTTAKHFYGQRYLTRETFRRLLPLVRE